MSALDGPLAVPRWAAAFRTAASWVRAAWPVEREATAAFPAEEATKVGAERRRRSASPAVETAGPAAVLATGTLAVVAQGMAVLPLARTSPGKTVAAQRSSVRHLWRPAEAGSLQSALALPCPGRCHDQRVASAARTPKVHPGVGAYRRSAVGSAPPDLGSPARPIGGRRTRRSSQRNIRVGGHPLHRAAATTACLRVVAHPAIRARAAARVCADPPQVGSPQAKFLPLDAAEL